MTIVDALKKHFKNAGYTSVSGDTIDAVINSVSEQDDAAMKKLDALVNEKNTVLDLTSKETVPTASSIKLTGADGKAYAVTIDATGALKATLITD